ncbi:MAG TPA: LytTR family DNA-binding domain-containing protein [Burkholderiaceae bacterium]|nr:LytTR family DNA-binding domain-containing protein [Burkholderiaceae bacterium]
MVLRVLIVDDEELARLRLRTLLADCVDPPVTVAGEAGSAAAALQWLAQQRADVLLLDIRMPGLDGLQLAQRLRAQPRAPALIFVTAHPEHALAAFEVQAIDYLTKPVRRARLQEALQRAAHWLQREAPAPSAFGALTVLSLPTAAGASGAAPTGGVIVVHDRGERLRVPLAEVLYLKAEAKYVTLRTAARSYLLDETLAELEQRLDGGFVRVHRNALVAVAAVRALERHLVADAPVTNFGIEVGSDLGGDATGWAVHIAATDEWLAVSRRQLRQVRLALEAA